MTVLDIADLRRRAEEWERRTPSDRMPTGYVRAQDVLALIALAERLKTALEHLRSATDSLMGDSDLPDDESAEMKAMQEAAAALAAAKEAGL